MRWACWGLKAGGMGGVGVLMANTGKCVNDGVIGLLLGGNRGIITYSVTARCVSGETSVIRYSVFRYGCSSSVCMALRGPSIYLRLT